MTLLTAAALGGCGLPYDPKGTSERIATTHQLRVGITHNPPWTRLDDGPPSGVEVDLVRKFAEQQKAEVLWLRRSETSLTAALEAYRIDMAIGGFEARTPWKAVAGVSQPFAKTGKNTKHVFLAPPGENRFIMTLDTFLTEEMRASKGAGG